MISHSVVAADGTVIGFVFGQSKGITAEQGVANAELLALAPDLALALKAAIRQLAAHGSFGHPPSCGCADCRDHNTIAVALARIDRGGRR